VTTAPNILVIILDALREDGLGAALEQPDRCLRATTCVSTAPWTLPSCTSILTGVSAAHHGHFWRNPPLGENQLLAALPGEYRKIGFVNNGAISAGSGVDSGFDSWSLSLDHDKQFRRALRAIRRAGGRRPSFILLHSNIVHDYSLPVTARYLPPGSPPVLGDRVISWRDTTEEDRDAAVAAYAACVTAQKAKVEAVLDAVRQRDDFLTVVTADHGEGFDYDLGRVHHGGRLHQDLLHVPLYFDLPSAVPAARRDGLSDALGSRVLSSTDIMPTILDLAGVRSLPDVDGVPAERIGDRTLVGEDRRYLYIKGPFRLNYRGHNKHMSEQDLEENRRMLDQLATGPLIRSFLRHPHKLIVTALTLGTGVATGAERDRLLEFGGRLLGSPVLALHADRLFAFEEYDIAADPLELHNRLGESADWARELGQGDWSGSVSVPDPDGTELPLASLLDGAEFVQLSGGAQPL